jgi:hypothetical protein
MAECAVVRAHRIHQCSALGARLALVRVQCPQTRQPALRSSGAAHMHRRCRRLPCRFVTARHTHRLCRPALCRLCVVRAMHHRQCRVPCHSSLAAPTSRRLLQRPCRSCAATHMRLQLRRACHRSWQRTLALQPPRLLHCLCKPTTHTHRQHRRLHHRCLHPTLTRPHTHPRQCRLCVAALMSPQLCQVVCRCRSVLRMLRQHSPHECRFRSVPHTSRPQCHRHGRP